MVGQTDQTACNSTLFSWKCAEKNVALLGWLLACVKLVYHSKYCNRYRYLEPHISVRVYFQNKKSTISCDKIINNYVYYKIIMM